MSARGKRPFGGAEQGTERAWVKHRSFGPGRVRSGLGQVGPGAGRAGPGRAWEVGQRGRALKTRPVQCYASSVFLTLFPFSEERRVRASFLLPSGVVGRVPNVPVFLQRDTVTRKMNCAKQYKNERVSARVAPSRKRPPTTTVIVCRLPPSLSGYCIRGFVR